MYYSTLSRARMCILGGVARYMFDVVALRSLQKPRRMGGHMGSNTLGLSYWRCDKVGPCLRDFSAFKAHLLDW